MGRPFKVPYRMLKGDLSWIYGTVAERASTLNSDKP